MTYIGEDGLAFMSCEDRNYYQDRRVTARRIPEPTHSHWHWAVCDLCDGRGKVVNPSIDASGLSREDFDEDPEFADDYRSGRYDIACPKCGGRSTIPVSDLTIKLANAALKKAGSDLTVRRDEDSNGYMVGEEYADTLDEALDSGLAILNLEG